LARKSHVTIFTQYKIPKSQRSLDLLWNFLYRIGSWSQEKLFPCRWNLLKPICSPNVIPSQTWKPFQTI